MNTLSFNKDNTNAVKFARPHIETALLWIFGTFFVLVRDMKRNLSVIAITLLGTSMLCAKSIEGGQNGDDPQIPVDTIKLRSVTNSAFREGEKLTYLLHYGVLNAGEATLEVKPTSTKIQDRKLYHFVGKGETLGAFEWFYKVRDTYDSYVDASGMVPWIFKRRVNEGGFIINQDYYFRQHKKEVKCKEEKGHEGRTKVKPERKYDVPENIQDMLSAFYYARTIDFSNAKKGDIFEVECFLDGELWPLKIKYLGKETIKSKSGKWRCMKFAPIVQSGRIFKKEEDLTVWISDDGNKIPILAKASILVGSIKMELTDFEGLANPTSKIK